MSRNFISEQTLIDQLLQDDTTAFEELFRRYCFPLFNYCNQKLDSPTDAKRIVRDIFISLWDRRHSLPVDFSLSLHLYTEVRKGVVKCVNEKLIDRKETEKIAEAVIPGFAVMHLKKAKQPVRPLKTTIPQTFARTHVQQNPVWNSFEFPLRNVKHAFRSILNFW